VGSGGALDNLLLSGEENLYNVIDTENDELVFDQAGIYQHDRRLVIDPVDTITTPFDVTCYVYDGSNKYMNRSYTIDTTARTVITDTLEEWVRDCSAKVYVKNNGDANIDFLSETEVRMKLSH